MLIVRVERVVACVVAVSLAGFGCRSAAPVSPAAPAAAAAVADPEEQTLKTGTVATSAPDDPVPSQAELGEEDAELPDEAGDPDALQKEALELCQYAEELLDQGDAEGAVAAVDQAYGLMLALPGNGDEAYLQAKEDIRLLAADLVERIYRSGRPDESSPMTSWDLGFALETNEHVQREIKSFSNGERQLFLDGYRRSGRFLPMIEAELTEAGLPRQLAWLPMVESWFKVKALSRASALGMWQFISSTGLRYGLSRDEWVDERIDPLRSTRAAIAYLTDLHGLFGDWPKALAAYNCGEARVQRLQRRSNEYLDFWDLYAQLPGETRRYVPRLFAALLIIEDPARFGFELPEPEPPVGATESVRVERAVQLAKLDAALGLDPGTLSALNPELRHAATPDRAYDLRVPADQAPEAVVASLNSLPEWKRPVPQYATHRVRSGESLSVIAKRYGTSVSAIMRSNNLRSAHRIWPGQRLKIPTRGGGAPVAQGTQVDGRYQVARGDTLGAIARTLGVSLSSLLRANQLSTRSTIYPGQWLRIP